MAISLSNGDIHTPLFVGDFSGKMILPTFLSLLNLGAPYWDVTFSLQNYTMHSFYTVDYLLVGW